MPNALHSKRSSSFAWTLCLMTSVFYAFQYILRLLPNVLKDDLMLNYFINAKDFGFYNAIYYAGYAAFHLPIAVMLERVGPKITISLSIFLCGIGIIPPLYSDSWVLALWGRFLLGVGSTTAILAVFYVIRINFPPVRFASILGMAVTLGFLGALFGNRPVGILNEWVGWENVLRILALASLALSGLFLILMPNQKDPSAQEQTSILSDLKELLYNKHVWAVALLSGLMVGPLEGFADAWGVPFLQTVCSIDAANAQILSSMIFFGFCFGAPLMGYVGERYKRPYTIIIISALFMGLIFLGLLMFKTTNIALLYVLMITIGVLCAYQIFIIFINTRVVPSHLVGISSSFTNMVVMSFGVMFHSVIGWIMVGNWEGQTLNDVPVYTQTAYVYGLAIIPIALFIAFAGFIFIKPKDESILLQENV